MADPRLEALPLRPETRARLDAAGVVELDALLALLAWSRPRLRQALGLSPAEAAALDALPQPKAGPPALGALGVATAALTAAKAPPWAPGDDLFAIALPPRASLVEAARALGVRDQAQRGTCVAFATVTAAALNRREAQPLSPEFLYYEMKALEGFPTQDGSFARISLNSLHTHGACAEALHPYDGRSRAPGRPIEGREPGPAARQDAAGRPFGPGLLASRIDKIDRSVHPWWDITAPKAIDADARRDGPLQLSRAALAGVLGLPPRAVVGCFAVFESSFAAAQATGTLSLPFPDEEQAGGHAMTLIGYEDDARAPGGGWLLLQNSWGAGWPARSAVAPGCFRMPYAYAARHQWEAGVVLLPGELDRLCIDTPGRYAPEPAAAASAAACAACGAPRAATHRFCTQCGAPQAALVAPAPAAAPAADRVAAMKARHADRLSAVRGRLEAVEAPRSHCLYCRAASFGYCITSPEKVHKHNTDGGHCAYCGSTSYGACITAPHRKHEHGPGHGCRFCGSRATGYCISSPQGVHVH